MKSFSKAAIYTGVLITTLSTQFALSSTLLSNTELTQRLQSGEIIEVAPGNRNSNMPEIPSSSASRHMSGIQAKTAEVYFAERFNIVLNKLSSKYETSKFSLKSEVRKAANLYKIDPIHIIGAIIGEHVFNVDLKDQAQEYSMKLGIWTSYFSGEHPFAKISECPELKSCETKSSNNYDQWACYENTWNSKMRGRTACGGQQFENKGLMMSYFNPTLAGKTYGLGQLGPMKILALTDLVSEYSGLPKLSIHEVDAVYAAALDPKTTIHYIAASIYKSIQLYKDITRFDISTNPGLTATLYNLGKEKNKALELNNYNKQAIKNGSAPKYPLENYYGWLINQNEAKLRHYVQ
ncbi:MAG: DUF1402 family protein [Pseudobdellovibrio sp.]